MGQSRGEVRTKGGHAASEKTPTVPSAVRTHLCLCEFDTAVSFSHHRGTGRGNRNH